MTRKQPETNNIDGFVVRRRSQNSGLDGSRQRLGIDDLSVPDKFLNGPPQGRRTGLDGNSLRPSSLGSQNAKSDGSGDIGDILRTLPGEIDENEQPKKRRFRWPSRKGWKRIGIGCAVLVLIIGGYFGIKFILTAGRVFNGNVFASLLSQGKPLKTDQYGRVNILLFGTSEDDPDHNGGELSDSILIASINQKDKSGYLVSVPRDLWVKYGRSCSAGYEGKINVAYSCGKEDGNGEQDKGAELLKNIVARDFGMEIPYYAQVNYTALRDSVNAVGGITVKIESDDPRGVLDRNFDWKCRYKCFYVKHPNGPANLNGEQALALARARNASGGYGLGGGNFDREQYQQKILIAIKDKASSAGVLANPVKVNGLLDTLGDNVNTNFETGEVKTLMKLGQEVDSSKLKRLNLVDEKDPILTTGNYGGQSIVRPVEGIYDFSGIKKFIRTNSISAGSAAIEDATTDVYNGSGIAGAAQKRSDALEAQGLTIGTIGNVPIGSHSGIKLYDLSGGKLPQTKTKLQQQLGVTAVSGNPPGITTSADFVIIIGTDAAN